MTTSSGHGARTVRILVVDDEEDNRELLAVVLTWEGFVVATAPGGAEALASVAKDRPDVVLLDVMMPDMDGYEVLARMKGDAATQSIPILMVSAMSDANAKARAIAAGAEDFLAKPLERSSLVSGVRRVLGLRNTGDFAPPVPA